MAGRFDETRRVNEERVLRNFAVATGFSHRSRTVSWVGAAVGDRMVAVVTLRTEGAVGAADFD